MVLSDENLESSCSEVTVWNSPKKQSHILLYVFI